MNIGITTENEFKKKKEHPHSELCELFFEKEDDFSISSGKYCSVFILYIKLMKYPMIEFTSSSLMLTYPRDTLGKRKERESEQNRNKLPKIEQSTVCGILLLVITK